uniref:Uncharacterized protein n=1 Tax=Anguilla anguilla TaxID=7936 RepID=A0A0E9W3D1_ANGAN
MEFSNLEIPIFCALGLLKVILISIVIIFVSVLLFDVLQVYVYDMKSDK